MTKDYATFSEMDELLPSRPTRKAAAHPKTVKRDVPSGASALTEAEAATYLSLSREFLRQRRSKTSGDRSSGPPFIKIGRSVRYLRADLDAWMVSLRVTS